ncbi:MAG: type II toxin-antitoxin system VapB family antitoxin [Geodermatophilaceae bacterium]|nr:type II toxin-antitoxin system VapB family antitoxin [Geodermatophilaceae bacterium]
MGRTNIDLDDDLIAEVMRRFGSRTKREAVDLALRRLLAAPVTTRFLLDIRGIGFAADLDELRGAKGSEPVERM